MFYKIALLALFAALATNAEVATGESAAMPVIAVDNKTTTTAPITTNNEVMTTTKATTTTTTTTTTTVAPSTTMPTAPPPTTQAPTTPAPTTPAPTTPAPTHAPTPAPTPAPWIVKDNVTGVTCILAAAKIHLSIPYNTTDKKTAVATITVPENANVTGHCGYENQTLGLSWNRTNYVMFTFRMNKTEQQYWISSISAKLTAYPDIFKNTSEKVMFYELTRGAKDFVTHFNKTYQCGVKQELALNVYNQTGKVAKLDFDEMKMNAFHFSDPSKVEFDSAHWCESGQTPDIVPIVVGCVLAALVILVLVGYLIGRRRSQARGYLSM